MPDAKRSESAPTKFGTFGGVFTPNVLTILGVIMFLRSGWVVGSAGLTNALLILCIAKLITILTSLSLSAIATNIKVKGGGAYFLISRSLGLEIGGSIGVPLFLAQAISVAFYIVGFTESLQFLFPDLNARLISSIVLVVIFVIAWVGADLAIKTQYFILALLVLSLISFFAGFHPVADWSARLKPLYPANHDFWSVFAIFFPAVTGIMAGVSMSGDLKEPSKSIPRGTLWAIGVTFVVYAAQMIWLSYNASREDLLTNNLVMKRISVFPPLIFAGLWAATISSALASLVGAPRTLQALGRDRVVPQFFGRGHGKQNEPRVALLVTLVIAEVCIVLGDLNLIAPVITMFFLVTYGMTNLAAGLERWVGNPSYRPTFRVHWLPSLLGGLGCASVMFLLNPLAFAVSTALIFGLYGFLKRRRYRTAWGDVRSGFWFALTRTTLLQMTRSHPHVKNWRPVLLVLVGNPKTRLRLVQFAAWLESHLGLLFLAQIVTGDWAKLLDRQAALQKSMEDFIQENSLSAVAETVITDDFARGVTTLLQVAGVGSLRPNTVLIGYSEDALKQPAFAGAVQRVVELKRNLIVFAESETTDGSLEPRIDVWWRAKPNSSLMLTLAHLLRRNAHWREHTVRVLRIIEEESAREKTLEGFQKMIDESRFEAEVEVIVSRDQPFHVIAKHSEKSAITFVGLSVQSLADKDDPLGDYEELVAALKGDIFITKSWQALDM